MILRSNLYKRVLYRAIYVIQPASRLTPAKIGFAVEVCQTGLEPLSSRSPAQRIYRLNYWQWYQALS